MKTEKRNEKKELVSTTFFQHNVNTGKKGIILGIFVHKNIYIDS